MTATDADTLRTDLSRRAERPVLVLVGHDGNAFNVLAKARRALLLAGRGDEWAAFGAEATCGNYQHLLATVMEWFEVE